MSNKVHIKVNTFMKVEEIDALTQYLEFHLLKFVEDMEQHVYDPNIIGQMYDRAYHIVSDVEEALDVQFVLSNMPKVANGKHLPPSSDDS